MSYIEAVCVIIPNKNNITGKIKFKQYKNKCKVSYCINNLSSGDHGFHVHEYGDITKGCKSGCSHFNPDNKTHGGRNSKIRHVGDLGNINSNSHRIAKGAFYDNYISLDYKNKNCILGRMIVIHKDPDDLGKGDNDESLITGNAGDRIACGIIGLCKSKPRKTRKK